jgi:hypothetical protein
MWHVWERKEKHAGFWLEKPEGKSPLKDLGLDGRIILKRMLKTTGGRGLHYFGSGYIPVDRVMKQWVLRIAENFLTS